MGQFKSIKIVPKIEVNDKFSLSLVYTPGVSEACLKIKENPDASFDYTNRENSVAVFANNYEEALKSCIFLKNTLNIDAYPLVVENISSENLKFVVENIEPSFCAIDLRLLQNEVKNVPFDVGIPVLKENVSDLKEFFLALSKNIFLTDLNELEGTFSEKALALRQKAGGVIETELSFDEPQKPVAIVSDGSAVLGLGNIGAHAAMPVMEGKAVLFKSLAGVDAMSLCIKTQDAKEISELVKLLENSFSGVNLEDITAPKCFEVEEELINSMSIPVFHDDQHGTAVVVLAALLNALIVAEKNIEDIKIVFSGAGAAACAVSRLLLQAGAKNITLTDINGVVYKDRPGNSNMQQKIAAAANVQKIHDSLKEVIKGADVFIGLSAGNILCEEMVKSMAKNAIVFALANPTPEIMPESALKAGALIVATGRSDFPNQINNSLVFPGLFKGLLETDIKKVTDKIKIECAIAVASLVSDQDLNKNYIIPDALNPKVPLTIVEALKNSPSKSR